MNMTITLMNTAIINHKIIKHMCAMCDIYISLSA